MDIIEEPCARQSNVYYYINKEEYYDNIKQLANKSKLAYTNNAK